MERQIINNETVFQTGTLLKFFSVYQKPQHTFV